LALYIADPLWDRRWDKLVGTHPQASAFHHRGWLKALQRTYGYQPLVLTSAAPNQVLSNGLVLCHVSSWITGMRLVSLPFSDHCQPLLGDGESICDFAGWLQSACAERRYRYVELRPLRTVEMDRGWQPSRSFCFQELDLRPNLSQIFQALHKDSIQRKIRRAGREHLTCECGRSEPLIEEFYRLLLLTRRRHRLLPQPRAWFRNLAECMGDNLQILVARKNGTAAAALLTLRHRSTVIYKYGCSDEKLHSLGGMPFLFWTLIEDGKSSGVERIDFGRSDLGQESLIAFKDKFGTTKSTLTYYQYTRCEKDANRVPGWTVAGLRQAASCMPDMIFAAAGGLLYRHIG
jgi:hypothetical protein